MYQRVPEKLAFVVLNVRDRRGWQRSSVGRNSEMGLLVVVLANISPRMASIARDR